MTTLDFYKNKLHYWFVINPNLEKHREVGVKISELLGNPTFRKTSPIYKLDGRYINA